MIDPQPPVGIVPRPGEPLARRDRSLLFRAGAFLLLTIAVDLWLVHHVGHGIGDVLKFGGLAAVVTGAMGYLDRMLSEADRETVRQPMMRAASLLRLAITTPALVMLYLVALVVGMSQSSIRVVLPDGTPPTNVTLTPVGTSVGHPFAYRAYPAKQARARRVPTTPFGTTYHLRVPGYLPKLIQVPPLTGAVIEADADLQRVPIVLLRVPFDAQSQAQDGARIRVFRRGTVVARGSGTGCAYVLGRLPKVEQRLDYWRIEATASVGLQGGVDSILLKWLDVSRLRSDYLPAPGDTLVVRMTDGQDRLLARAVVAVGSEDLIDVLMTFVPVGEGGP